jgi:ferredoxin
MNVVIDPSRCQGHTLCAMAAPEVFVLSDDDGHASVTPEVARDGVPEQWRTAVRTAAAGCPESAIVLRA